MMRRWKANLNPLSLFLHHPKTNFALSIIIPMASSKDGKIVVENLQAGLEKLLAPFKIVKMEYYKTEIFQVWMENQHQLDLILKRQPWIVSQHILQIVPWMDIKESKEFDFNKLFIWVQLLNFPEIFQDKEIV
ncbi:hypothetical protein IFM89_033089 [Coptis chinensis]|uniref:DUF4283 domain-containing protein n=1 Tax=Coptis chinensis TaxID=261450 RepID=A0A835M7W7_9MAGN|nr:hypothetical protein IFM89_033089 [Coptis chinensis]